MRQRNDLHQLPPAPGDQSYQGGEAAQELPEYVELIEDVPAVDTSNVVTFDPAEVVVEPYYEGNYPAPVDYGGGRWNPRDGGRRHGGHHGGGGYRGVHHGVGATDISTGSNMLGLSLVAIAAGGATGGYFGGMWGALAGILYGGAAVNTLVAGQSVLRGDAASDSEAMKRGTFAVVGAGLATFVLYKTQTKTKNKDEE